MIEFVVTSTAKNCPTVRQCVTSVARQVYPRDKFEHVYIAADHDTLGVARAVPVDKKPTVRFSPLTIVQNVYEFWQTVPDHKVIVWLDGDDWLVDTFVLARLNQIYMDRDPWLTYGSFRCSGKPPFVHPWFGTRYPTTLVRQDHWRASHLKTFRAGLVKRVKREHLARPDGSFTNFCTDRIFMYPMLEMAEERYEAITEELSVYNTRSSTIFGASERERGVREAEEHHELARIQNLPRYDSLTERPW